MYPVVLSNVDTFDVVWRDGRKCVRIKIKSDIINNTNIHEMYCTVKQIARVTVCMLQL